MKKKLALSVLLTSFACAAVAGPLVKEHIDQNAKWLLHIDLDQLRSSKLGQFLIREVILKQVDAAKAQGNPFLTNMDVVKIIGQLHSLTAYGTGFEPGPKFDGVLMLQVEPETRKILEGMAAGLVLNGDGASMKTNEAGKVVYSLKETLFASPQDKGLILLSKSEASINKAAEIVAGKSENLKKSQAFSDFPPVKDNFIILAVAEGFQDNLPIPPQAKVLRQADGGRIVLGERSSEIFLNIALKAKDPEVLKQMQSVVEGIVALGTLSQSENKELQTVLQSIKVVGSERILTVTAGCPVDSVINRAGQMLAEKSEHHHHKAEPATEEKPESSAGDSK